MKQRRGQSASKPVASSIRQKPASLRPVRRGLLYAPAVLNVAQGIIVGLVVAGAHYLVFTDTFQKLPSIKYLFLGLAFCCSAFLALKFAGGYK